MLRCNVLFSTTCTVYNETKANLKIVSLTSNAAPIRRTEGPIEVPEDLQRVLDSRVFEKSAALRRLLLYLWGHRSADINEYAIATEALDRREDFDPRTDAAVRVQIARLRQKLKEFYDEEGASSAWRITIPLGSYQVILDPSDKGTVETPFPIATKPTAPELSAETPAYPAAKPRSWFWHTGIAAAALALGWFGGVKWQQLRAVRHEASRQVAVPLFWQNLLKPGEAVRIVMPTPVFFTWKDKENTLTVRDPAVNSFRDLGTSAALTDIARRLGQPILAQDYMVASDTRASFRLAQYLQPFGTRVVASSSSDLPPESTDNENLILLGTVGTLSPYRTYLDRLHFRIPEHQQYIEDTLPSRGATARFDTARESPTRIVAPGIVAVLPGRNPSSFILVLAGYHTNALVSYLTSAAGQENLEKARSVHGNPDFFEAVVLSEINDMNPLRSWIVDFKPFHEEKSH
jgi:hypothetical protein